MELQQCPGHCPEHHCVYLGCFNFFHRGVDDCRREGRNISLSWAPDGEFLAVGLNNSTIQLWDSTSLLQLRTLTGHSARGGALAWNGPTLATGSRDSTILDHDVGIRDHVIEKIVGHDHEVCGLKQSPSGQQLASGGSDNLLHIWDSAAGSS